MQSLAKLGVRRGLSRLAGWFGGSISVQLGVVAVEFNLKSPHERHLFLGFSERDVLRIFEIFLRPGDVVIDVGANIGFHAAYMANLVGSSGRVYAFEPTPKLIPRLLHLERQNPLHNIDIVRAAVSDKEGEATLYESSIHELSSLNQNWSPSTKLQEISVQTITLDTFLSHQSCHQLRLVKIDVEGHQYAVFKGLQETLARGLVDIYVFELTPPDHQTFDTSSLEILSLLEQHGYVIYGISPDGLVPRHVFDENLRALSPGYNLIALLKSVELPPTLRPI